MTDWFTFTVPAGIQRTEEIIDLHHRIQASGKPVRIQAYDTVQGLQWNGGRLTFSPELFPGQDLPISSVSVNELPEAVNRVRRLNAEGIGFNLVFNNVLESLDEEDEDGNYLLEHLHSELNGVTVATESLWEHVSTHFPKFEKTSSICFAYAEDEQYRRACDRYEKVVVLPVLAYEPERLKTLPLERLVFIANDECYLFCPRKEHYRNISRCSLGGNASILHQSMNLKRDNRCLGAGTDYWNRTNQLLDQEWMTGIWKTRLEQLAAAGIKEGDPDFRLTIAPATLRNLVRLGVRNFKLQGREFNDAFFQSRVIEFLERMIKDEIPA